MKSEFANFLIHLWPILAWVVSNRFKKHFSWNISFSWSPSVQLSKELSRSPSFHGIGHFCLCKKLTMWDVSFMIDYCSRLAHIIWEIHLFKKRDLFVKLAGNLNKVYSRSPQFLRILGGSWMEHCALYKTKQALMFHVSVVDVELLPAKAELKS